MIFSVLPRDRRWTETDQRLNRVGGKKSFFPFLVEIEEVDSVSKEKSSICWVKTEKCDTKLQYVIQTKVNLLGPLYWISEGIYLKKKKIPSFSSSFFFSPFEWQLLLFFRNNREANSSQINVASVTTPFWAQPSPRTKAQSSEWINTQLALVKRFQNKEDGGKSDAEEVPREFAAR